MKMQLTIKEPIADKLLKAIFRLANIKLNVMTTVLFTERKKRKDVYYHIQQGIMNEARKEIELKFFNFEGRDVVAFRLLILRFNRKREVILKQPIGYHYDGKVLLIEAIDTDFTDTFMSRMLFTICQDFQMLTNCDVEMTDANGLKNTLKAGRWLAAYLHTILGDKTGYNATVDEALESGY